MGLGTHQFGTGVWWEWDAVGLMGSSELGREYGLLGFVSEELIIWRGGGHTRRDLYAVDFAPITELSGAVHCWAAGSTWPTGGITQPYLPLLSSSVAWFCLGLDILGGVHKPKPFGLWLISTLQNVLVGLFLCILAYHNPPQTTNFTIPSLFSYSVFSTT